MEIQDGLSDLMIARRLIRHAQRADDQRKGKKVDEKTAQEEMEEDQVLLSGGGAVDSDRQASGKTVEDTQIRLADLIARLQEKTGTSDKTSTQSVQIQYQQTVEESASIRYQSLEKVEGLVRRSTAVAETDRYRFDFMDGTTFKITDKWANRSTTIWGDPHVDVDDVEGDRDGDFQDLKESDSHTTLMLQDGTRVTFSARDNGIIEAVDIFKGSQHLHGLGGGSLMFNDQTGRFASAVDKNSSSASSVPLGDVVYAGGDGNDWFTGAGTLLWGKTTAAPVTRRPAATLQVEYRQSIRQQLSINVVNKQA